MAVTQGLHFFGVLQRWWFTLHLWSFAAGAPALTKPHGKSYRTTTPEIKMCLCGNYMVRQQADRSSAGAVPLMVHCSAAGQAEEPDIVKVTWVTDQASSETSSEVVIPRISGCSAHEESHLMLTQPSCTTCKHDLLSQVNTLQPRTDGLTLSTP